MKDTQTLLMTRRVVEQLLEDATLLAAFILIWRVLLRNKEKERSHHLNYFGFSLFFATCFGLRPRNGLLKVDTKAIAPRLDQGRGAYKYPVFPQPQFKENVTQNRSTKNAALLWSFLCCVAPA